MNKVTIGTGLYHANLKELLKDNKEQADYLLKDVYFLEIAHNFERSSLAVFASNEDRVVLTDDLQLIKDVWSKLPPYLSRVHKAKYYVHKHGWVGYKVNQDGGDSASLPQHFITREELHNTFEIIIWKSTPNTSQIESEDFHKNIEVSIARIQKAA